VVEDLDLEEVPGADEVAGDADVGFGGGGITAGMVMGEDEGMGAGGDGWAEDFAGMDEDLVEEAFGDGIDAEEAAPGIEEEDLETFDRGGDGVIAEECGDGFRVIEDRGFEATFLGEAACEGEGGLEGYGLVATDAASAELLPGGACDCFEGAEAEEEFFGDGDRGGALDAGAEEDGDEFCGTEGIGAAFCEAFARTVGFRKVVDPGGLEHG
jgi:hypothetical protein